VRGLTVFAALLLTSCNAWAETPAPLRVLFVGNSLTYYNDVPRIAAAIIAAAQSHRAIHVEMLASGGATMTDHLREGQLAVLLETHDYDIVVLQDVGGFPACEDTFPGCTQAVASVCEAAKLVREAHARPILFGTWQSLAADQHPLSAATLDEAKHCGAEAADVGAAMQRFIERISDVPPWSNDGHPTLEGSWVAAATLSRAILRHDIQAGLSIPQFCRKRWQASHLSHALLASRQDQPEVDCERPSDPILRAALRAADVTK
jgi:hypothetical protein